MSWIDAARTRARLLLSGRASESRTDEEFHFHVDMETERLVRAQGLSRDEARRRALAAFGGVQNHRETMREGRGTAWLGGLSLDLKLGIRILLKYPGLTIVGGLAMAFGIWFGAVAFHLLGLVAGTTLPIPGGDRIVKIQNWDAKNLQEEDRVLYDYQLWRFAKSITDIGAWRDASVNLVGADGGAQPAAAAEVTASAFRMIPTRPALGRILEESDQQGGAAPVVVLGHELWTARFDRDPGIVGRSVRLGSGFATVVGVMPEGYAFPVAHELWMPLRTDVAGVLPRNGAAITVFGRLAPGVTIEGAQAELTAFGKRLAAEQPATHADVQPHVIPYAQPGVDTSDMTVVRPLIYFFLVVLMVVVCSTVALLLFARAATRETEILVRTALGASRRRIVTQLFAEALVLAGVAAVVGLGAAQFALTRFGKPYLEMNYGRLPFWYDFDLSPTTIAYALGLAVIGALVAGVIPARKITSGLGTRLRAGTAGGGGVSFGGVWTAVIVTQVALTVVLPAVAMLVRNESDRIASVDVGFPTREYLGVTLGIDAQTQETLSDEMRAALRTRLSGSAERLRQRLEGEPGVAGATLVDQAPLDYHSHRLLEVATLPGSTPAEVSTAAIHPSYFDVLNAPILAGRAFAESDLRPDARVVIVDQGFADLVLGGRNPIGHHVRFTSNKASDSAAVEPTYEIVGLVKELGMAHAVEPQRSAGVYLPILPGMYGDLSLLVHGRGDPVALGPRVRELAMAVDPALRIDQMLRVDQTVAPLVWFLDLWTRLIAGLTAVALLLSLSGIYAVLSYIVARRTREIGVRVALGSSARRVISSIFRRPLTQVSLGVMAGCVLIAMAAIGIQRTTQFSGTDIGGMSLGEGFVLAGYAILMLGVCILACVVPTIRALRVQPTEALRAE